MNPIFTRRNRSMAISSQQSNNRPSNNVVSSRVSREDTSSDEREQQQEGREPSSGSFISPVSDLSPDPLPQPLLEVTNRNGSPQPPQPHRNIGIGQRVGNSSFTVAQNFLASKQNMLAQVSLTPEENLARQSPSPVEDLSPDDAKKSSKLLVKSEGGVDRHNETERADGNQLMLCDIEDEDFEFGDSENDYRRGGCTLSPPFPAENFLRSGGGGGSSGGKNGNMYSSPGDAVIRMNSGRGFGEGRPVLKVMDTQTWRDLKMTSVGQGGALQDGWIHQAFSFDHNIPYGLVQKRGGPCGVLAVVQALILRNLMFGSPYCEDDDLPLPDPTMIFSNDATATRILSFRRTKALVCALTEILWRCGNVESNKSVFNAEDSGSSSGVWKDFKLLNLDRDTQSGATVCFNGACIGAEMRTFDQIAHLKNYIHVNLQKFDCVSLVYSAILSRGIDNVQQDLDFPNCPLIVSHGYCSQELVNLLTVGKAISNVFDNQVSLDDKVLKGIESRCDIGLLSLFEHYDSCQVGNFLKNPKFPLWIVCSESHFSILFAPMIALTSDPAIDKFELYYYDGLARQQNHIKLTVDLNPTAERVVSVSHFRIQAGSSAKAFNNNNNNNNNDCDDEHLVPPIEKCIRTKWPTAVVDWNETEPIL